MRLFERLLEHFAGALAGLLHLFPNDLLDLLPQLRHDGLEYLCQFALRELVRAPPIS